MNITKIELLNFRNYRKKIFDKFSNLNIIIGKNGIGKTSIIESIYIGSLAKSFKTNNEWSIIKKGENFFKIKIACYDYGIKKNLELLYDKFGTKTKINSFPQKKLSEFISQYRIIILSPDELKLIRSAPSVRRNYFNIELSQLNKQYLKNLNNYNNLIKNKNEYLKRLNLNKSSDIEYLNIIDEKISEEGLKIYNFRREYIFKINIFKLSPILLGPKTNPHDFKSESKPPKIPSFRQNSITKNTICIKYHTIFPLNKSYFYFFIQYL